VTTRGDISTEYLYILKAWTLSFKMVRNFFFEKSGLFSMVKVEIFVFLLFLATESFCEIRFTFMFLGTHRPFMLEN